MSEQNTTKQSKAKQSTAIPPQALSQDKMADRDATSAAAAVEPVTVDEMARMRSLGGEFMNSMSTPKMLKPNEWSRKMVMIESLVKAKSQEDKWRVKLALVHVGIVYGTGPNTDFKEITFAPGGSTTPVLMSRVVDGITSREYHRRFMNSLGHMVQPYVDANPDIQSALAERAARAGIPITKLISVVDFGTPSVDNPENLGYRHLAKQAAVNRANNTEDNSLFSKAKNAVADVQDVKHNGMRNTASGSGDRYGPM